MKNIVLLILVTFFFLPVISNGEEIKDQVLENKLKAVFVYNFTKYIEWPANDSSGTFLIGVLGDSGIITPLREIQKEKVIKGRSIDIVTYRSPDDIMRCNVLFISSSEEPKLKEIQEKIGKKPVLTIGDTPGFAGKGIAINLVMVGGKMRFEINSRSLKAARLKVSSQLLKLAILVK